VGPFPADKVIGRAFVIVWPVDRFSGLGVPQTFDRGPLRGGLVPLPGALAVGVVASAAWWRRRRRG
jgi:signal peptidase I